MAQERKWKTNNPSLFTGYFRTQRLGITTKIIMKKLYLNLWSAAPFKELSWRLGGVVLKSVFFVQWSYTSQTKMSAVCGAGAKNVGMSPWQQWQKMRGVMLECMKETGTTTPPPHPSIYTHGKEEHSPAGITHHLHTAAITTITWLFKDSKNGKCKFFYISVHCLSSRF